MTRFKKRTEKVTQKLIRFDRYVTLAYLFCRNKDLNQLILYFIAILL